MSGPHSSMYGSLVYRLYRHSSMLCHVVYSVDIVHIAQ